MCAYGVQNYSYLRVNGEKEVAESFLSSRLIQALSFVSTFSWDRQEPRPTRREERVRKSKGSWGGRGGGILVQKPPPK
jgi:hypothetical protein